MKPIARALVILGIVCSAAVARVDADTQAANQYLQELEHFCHCVQISERPIVTGEDGRHCVEIINATYLSHFRKQWVELPLEDTSELPELFERYRSQQEAEKKHR